MIEDVRKVLYDRGVLDEHVHTESFYAVPIGGEKNQTRIIPGVV